MNLQTALPSEIRAMIRDNKRLYKYALGSEFGAVTISYMNSPPFKSK
ncbi:hypothetical protein [Macrococcoides canis]|nr:hypothetical protein [Macrococcus canis]